MKPYTYSEVVQYYFDIWVDLVMDNLSAKTLIQELFMTLDLCTNQ